MLRTQREWAREYSMAIIHHAERWCEERGLILDCSGTYPRMPYSLAFESDMLQWQAWHIDALMGAAHGVMTATDPNIDTWHRAREWQYACRCFWQACEYYGRCGGRVADASWHDEHQRMRAIMDDAMRLVPSALES